MGVGSLLEKARVEQGLTIEELAERTKIRPQFLQAIEEEQYHLLPDQAYVRPFIRTYARALGVEDQLQVEVEPRESTLRVDDLSASIRERRERAHRHAGPVSDPLRRAYCALSRGSLFSVLDDA